VSEPTTLAEKIASKGREKGLTRFGPHRAHVREGVMNLSQAELQDPEILRKCYNAINEALEAKEYLWNNKTHTYDERPDHKTRLRSAELYLGYAVGKPVERILTTTKHIKTEDDRLKDLTPEALELLADKLRKHGQAQAVIENVPRAETESHK